jgi:hypothetical protein
MESTKAIQSNLDTIKAQARSICTAISEQWDKDAEKIWDSADSELRNEAMSIMYDEAANILAHCMVIEKNLDKLDAMLPVAIVAGTESAKAQEQTEVEIEDLF